ncbi:hypothetical protein EON63_24395 [archaeon]|nr:MAG: hypothetical protein EON63_24395 [archaeon]
MVIHYKCASNIVGLSKSGMGLIPFRTYTKERILSTGLREQDINYIYILTESPAHSRMGGRCANCCPHILPKLYTYISSLFPKAVVVLKRGGDPFLDFYRIQSAPVVFCGTALFCLWPALANTLGTVFLPITPLFGGATNTSNAPRLGSNKVWLPSRYVDSWDGSIENLVQTLQTK